MRSEAVAYHGIASEDQFLRFEYRDPTYLSHIESFKRLNIAQGGIKNYRLEGLRCLVYYNHVKLVISQLAATRRMACCEHDL